MFKLITFNCVLGLYFNHSFSTCWLEVHQTAVICTFLWRLVSLLLETLILVVAYKPCCKLTNWAGYWWISDEWTDSLNKDLRLLLSMLQCFSNVTSLNIVHTNFDVYVYSVDRLCEKVGGVKVFQWQWKWWKKVPCLKMTLLMKLKSWRKWKHSQLLAPHHWLDLMSHISLLLLKGSVENLWTIQNGQGGVRLFHRMH